MKMTPKLEAALTELRNEAAAKAKLDLDWDQWRQGEHKRAAKRALQHRGYASYERRAEIVGELGDLLLAMPDD